MDDSERDDADTYLWRAELLNMIENYQTLHYEQVFGNMFERRESTLRVVLMKHRRKSKGEQVILLQMDQQLKT